MKIVTPHHINRVKTLSLPWKRWTEIDKYDTGKCRLLGPFRSSFPPMIQALERWACLPPGWRRLTDRNWLQVDQVISNNLTKHWKCSVLFFYRSDRHSAPFDTTQQVKFGLNILSLLLKYRNGFDLWSGVHRQISRPLSFDAMSKKRKELKNWRKAMVRRRLLLLASTDNSVISRRSHLGLQTIKNEFAEP